MLSPYNSSLPLDARIHVAGHRGLVGSAVWRHLEERGHTALIGRPSAELDLRDRDAVFRFYREHDILRALLAIEAENRVAVAQIELGR